MRNRTLANLDSSCSRRRAWTGTRSLITFILGSRLTGIVTTTDNGGSTGRIRRSEGGIAWRDAELPQPADNGTERRLRDV
ncbi:hypothetical protein ACLB1T_22260 [Escherichia coli]